MKPKNIIWHDGHVPKDNRAKLIGYKNKVLWFTGLSGSGKSTIARQVEQELYNRGILSYVLDGDNIRHGLNRDLGFSREDRAENIRRISEVAKLFYDSGIFVLVCFISPYREARNRARALIGEDFIEIFVDCPAEECERRDSKGFYKKARAGEIADFTGISAPYEKPENPEIVVNTEKLGINESAQKIINYLGISNDKK